MSSNSAFRRGEGTWSAVRRATADPKICLSCTNLFRISLFHPGDTEARRKTSLICRFLFRIYLRLLPLIDEINHLADVVLHVRRALQNHVQADFGIRAGAGVF